MIWPKKRPQNRETSNLGGIELPALDSISKALLYKRDQICGALTVQKNYKKTRCLVKQITLYRRDLQFFDC